MRRKASEWDEEGENGDEIGLTKIKTKNNIYFVSSVPTID